VAERNACTCATALDINRCCSSSDGALLLISRLCNHHSFQKAKMEDGFIAAQQAVNQVVQTYEEQWRAVTRYNLQINVMRVFADQNPDTTFYINIQLFYPFYHSIWRMFYWEPDRQLLHEQLFSIMNPEHQALFRNRFVVQVSAPPQLM
jgi:hypothetical protein